MIEWLTGWTQMVVWRVIASGLMCWGVGFVAGRMCGWWANTRDLKRALERMEKDELRGCCHSVYLHALEEQATRLAEVVNQGKFLKRREDQGEDDGEDVPRGDVP